MNLPIALILPYPPSDNKRYYILSKRLTEETRHYRNAEVRLLWLTCRCYGLETITEEVRAFVYLYPCNRRRDTTNCLKELWDSLQANHILENDRLVKSVQVEVCGVHKSDAAVVEFWPLDSEPVTNSKVKLDGRFSEYFYDPNFQGRLFYANHVPGAIRYGQKIVEHGTAGQRMKTV